MDRITNVDFTRFIPIMQRSTDEVFVFAVDENPNFDTAKAEDKFICYPVTENNEADFSAPVELIKKNIDLLFIRIR